MDPDEGSTKTADDSAYASAGTDQAESFANDPKNHVDDLKDRVGSDKGSSGNRLSQFANGAKSFAGSKNAKIGGAGVGIAGILVAGMLALLPLKIEALMKNIFQKRIGDKIEHMEEKRADKMVIKYLTKSGSSEAVYADGTLLGSLYKNWKLKNFESKFSASSGIKIEKGTNGGIKLTTADGKVTPTMNEADFEKYLNKPGDLKGIDARRFIRDVTRSETHWIQVYKRHNLRTFMKNAYGIHKWSWFTGKEGEQGGTDFNNASIDSSSSQYSEDVGDIIDCTGGTNCPSDEGERDKPLGEPKAGAKIDTTGATGEDLKGTIKSSVKDAVDSLKKLSPKAVTERVLTEVLSKFLAPEITKTISSKAVPVVGQILLIDQVARLDNFFYSGNADKALRAVHKVEYAKEYAKWAVIADNFKDPKHQMSGDELNAAMLKIQNIADSAAFNDVFLGKGGGKAIDPKLGVSDLPGVTPIKDGYKQYSDPIPAIWLLRGWTHTVDANPISKGIIDGINSGIGKVVGVLFTVPGVQPAFDSISKPFTGLLSSVLHDVIAPAVDGTEKDQSEINAIDAGAAVTGQDFTKSVGGHTMTLTQTDAQNRAIALEKSQSTPGLFGRLFSPDYAPSMVNQLAVVAPHSAGDAVGQFSSYSLATMKNPFHLFSGIFNLLTGKAHADATINLYGLQDYGYTEAELDQPLTTLTDRNGDGKIDSTDCKTNPDGSAFSDAQLKAFNDPKQGGQICLLDVATAESLGAVFTTADDGGLGDVGTTASGTSSSGAGGSGQLPSGTAQQLAQQILDNTSIDKTGRLVMQDLTATANGQPGSAGAKLSATLLKLILLAAQSQSFSISAIESGGTGHCGDTPISACPTDPHYTGDAFDVNVIAGQHPISGRDSVSVVFIKSIMNSMPQGSGFGQSACGPTIALPAGVGQFEDSCNHLHVQIPVGTP